LKISSKVSH